jgi:hypothetical protein
MILGSVRRFGWICVLFLAAAVSVCGQAPAGAGAPGGTSNQANQQTQPNDQSQPDQQTQPGQTQPGQTPGLMTPMKSQNARVAYEPITIKDRFRWLITNTTGPGHVAGTLVAAGFDTGLDSPKEYGPGFDGFGKRFGVNIADSAVQSTMEISLGSIWGEDPRYFPVPGKPFGARVKNVVMRGFETRRRDGSFAPAYARFIAIPGTNFLANTWWPDSHANTEDALIRTAEGFATKIGNNAWDEFWPGVKARMFHKN